MKVLLIGPNNDRIELHLLKVFKEQGIELEVILSPESPAAELCHELGWPCFEHEFSGRIDGPGKQLIEERIRAFNPDLVHAVTNRALSNSLLALKKLKHPAKVIAYRGTTGHLSWFDPAAWMSYLNLRVDRIICVSDAVRRYLRGRGIPEKKLVVIHKGHDPDWYPPVTPPVDVAAMIPKDAFVIGFLGNMRPVKGVDFLIQSLPHLPEPPEVHLLLVGEIRDDRLASLAASNPERIHGTGFRQDAVDITGLFDISVMPSIKREGLPKALIESMARKIPCIGTDVGGIPELIEHEISGLIVPPRDPKALATAITRLIEDPDLRKRLGEGGRARVEGAFHIRHTVEKVLALYNSLSSSSG